MSEKGDFEENNKRFWCLPLGTTLNQGTYVIKDVLGMGGFGITYLGEDTILRRYVAIKEYCPQGQEGDLGLFLREAQMLSELSHIDGIVEVHSYFQENNTAYMVMDYVESANIKDYVSQHGRLDPDTVLRMVKRIIAALQRVHDAKLIHRDISADNLLLSPEGELTLIDLGAARGSDAVYTGGRTSFCKDGFSPIELYSRNGPQGPWTDVYSICATMYYMMTGICPVPAPDRLIGKELPPLSDISEAEVPEDISRVIQKGMEVKHEFRIQSMAQMYKLLYDETLPDTRSDLLGGDSVQAAFGNRIAARAGDRTVRSHILSLTQAARELGGIKEERNNRRKWFVMKVAVVFVLCLSGVMGAVFLWRTPRFPQESGRKDQERVMAASGTSVSAGVTKPTPVQKLEPTEKPTPQRTRKPTLKPTQKPTPKPTRKPTPKPTRKPASSRTDPTPKPASARGSESDMIPLPEDNEGLAGSLDDLD